MACLLSGNLSIVSVTGRWWRLEQSWTPWPWLVRWSSGRCWPRWSAGCS